MTTYLRWCRDKAEAERKQSAGYVPTNPSPPPSALVAAGRAERSLDYVPITGPGVDAHDARKEHGALTDQEPVVNEILRRRLAAAGRLADLGWLQGENETIRERRPGDK